MEFFLYAVGIICAVLCVFAVWERRQNRAMLERLRSEVLNHQRKNAMNEYHEPGSWRR